MIGSETENCRPACPSSDSTDLESVLARFAPISLPEVANLVWSNRVDTKFALSEAQLPELLSALSSEYRVLVVDGVRLTRYTTLYFDTPQRDCYRHHHNGTLQRKKYRMRSYGQEGPTFFEVKCKTNKRRTMKQRIEVPAISPSINGSVAEVVIDEGGLLAGLEPQVWTLFSRFALVGCHFAERVTVDVDLEFSDPRGRSETLPGVAIVEVKQSRFSRHSPIYRKLREMGFSPLRISKYCVGSSMLDQSLKKNLFKSTIRALGALTQ